MPIEKSAGAVIFKREGNKILYLLLHYPGASHRANSNYWDFPKGHIEKGEKLKETVKREIKEETGLEEIKFVKGFKETIKYFFNWQGETVLKFVTFYLVEAKKNEIQISPEHIGYGWFSFKDALKKLKFENSKEILKKANQFLTSH
ncbi:NUDIX domain-containing protein [Candidatus Parcubacteria bacterium]|nr:NUDIX domain-containing protein [Candidatus Parcubacteria bacterium]